MEGVGRLVKEIASQISMFIKKINYILPVIITAILSFGFTITNYSVNIDSLEYERYYESGNELLAQGRFGIVFINKIIHIFEFNPFFNDLLAVILIILSTIILCALFKKITNNKLNEKVYTIFSCLFVSYPLISEIFLYNSLNIAIAYILIAVTLYILDIHADKLRQKCT